MGINVVVKSGSGDRVLGLSDVGGRVPPPQPAVFDPLIPANDWDRFPLLCGIDPYGVTIFNRRQSQRLLLELEDVEANTNDPSRRSLVWALRLLIAKQEAKPHRLLWFLGD